jgi:hypothetical protein
LIFVLFAGACGALLITFGGVQWLTAQIAAAGDFKSGLIAGVLGLGLVLLGPVLLWALAALLPRWWFRAAGARLKQLIFHEPSGRPQP